MPTRPPLQGLADPDGYIRDHLANELRWLLRAANEWRVQDNRQLNIGGYQVQVYAMDSAFLHARTLFEVLTSNTTSNHYGVDQFRIHPLMSSHYAKWKGALHEYLMHAQPRDTPRQLPATDGTMKDLKTMAPDFAEEVAHLWDRFAVALRKDGQLDRARLVKRILADARQEADDVLTNEMATCLYENCPHHRK